MNDDQKSEWETPGAATIWTGSLGLLGSVMVWVKEGDSEDILQQKTFFFQTQLEAWGRLNLFSAPHTARTFVAIDAYTLASPRRCWISSTLLFLGSLTRLFQARIYKCLNRGISCCTPCFLLTPPGRCKRRKLWVVLPHLLPSSYSSRVVTLSLAVFEIMSSHNTKSFLNSFTFERQMLFVP